MTAGSFFQEVFRVEREVFQRRASFCRHIKTIISECPVLVATWPSALGEWRQRLAAKGGPANMVSQAVPGWGRECVPGPGGVAHGGGVSPPDPAWAFQGTCLHSWRCILWSYPQLSLHSLLW